MSQILNVVKPKEVQLKKMSCAQKEKKLDLAQELPQICDQIFERFKSLFQLEYLNVDRDLFSQFLLLCELSSYYSKKNKTQQQQILRLNDDNEKFRLFINNVLYLEFKICKSMNLNIQKLQNSITQTLLKFINQDTKCQETINKIYWNAFLRFKTYYIDQNQTTNNFGYFLLFLNEQSPIDLFVTSIKRIIQDNFLTQLRVTLINNMVILYTKQI